MLATRNQQNKGSPMPAFIIMLLLSD